MKHLIGVLVTLFGSIITGYGVWFTGSAIEINARPGNDGFAGFGIAMGVVIVLAGVGVLAIGKALRKSGLKGKLL